MTPRRLEDDPRPLNASRAQPQVTPGRSSAGSSGRAGIGGNSAGGWGARRTLSWPSRSSGESGGLGDTALRDLSISSPTPQQVTAASRQALSPLLRPPLPTSPCGPRSSPARVWVSLSPPLGSGFYFPGSLPGSSWRWAKNKTLHGSCVAATSLGQGTNRDLPPPPPPPRRVSLAALPCPLEPKRSQILCWPRGKPRSSPEGPGDELGVPQDLSRAASRAGCKNKRSKRNRGTKSSRSKCLQRKDGGKRGLKMFYF